MRKTIIFATGLILILALSTACKIEKSTTVKKPNIIFLFADDLSYKPFSDQAEGKIHTPNIDELAKNGASFSHAYNMGGWNGAICVASRAMINTGRFIWNARSWQDRQQELVDNNQMWSQILKQAGYRTYMTGKWHVRTDAEVIFDTVTHVRPGMPRDLFRFSQLRDIYNSGPDLTAYFDSLPPGYNRPLSESDTTWLPWDKKWGGFWEGGKHWSEVLGDDAINFIEQAKDDTSPFFMYLAFNAPHDPRQSPKEFVNMYPLEEVDVPESFIPEYPYKDIMGCAPSLRDEALAPFPRTEYAVKVHRQEYFAITSHMDRQIGRIISALKENDQLDNTYIFFTADHGLAVGNHGLLGKQNMYDHSVRVPLLVMGPGIPKNKEFDADVYLQDIMPSTLDLAGVEKPEFVDFNSLMPIIKGENETSPYPAIYGCYQNSLQRMIRTKKYKLILYPEGKIIRLYDLEKDPLELKDLSESADYKEVVSDLFNDLLELQIQMQDTLDLKRIYGKM